ncbi:MAG: hypothetical protein BGO63_16890 [Candidatus Accumulibacter sp. 66-26]|nr:NAD(P)H-dependent oxidoreductase [Accumulibacter sp.]OJW50887.1 MAG: hypothetical protein BGO63_16890 [Candidatus Accumulibacter sp. 66-26]
MTIKLLAFSGSSRRDSLNGRLLAAGVAAARAQGAEVTLLDLRELALPIYDGDLEAESGLPAGAFAFRRALAAHHALLVASPEYNGLFSPLLKNAVDWASRPVAGEAQPFSGRVAGLLAASPGALGGMRALPVVRQLFNNLGVLVTPGMLSLPHADQAFAADGQLLDATRRKALDRVVGDLLATAGALRPPTA